MATKKHTRAPAARPVNTEAFEYPPGRFVTAGDLAIAGLPRPARCPFCGAAEDVLVILKAHEQRALFYTSSDCCGAAGPSAASAEEVAAAWNTRKSKRAQS